MSASEAYELGQLDFEDGIGLECNPYPPDSIEWHQWQAGWRTAERDKTDADSNGSL